MFLREKTRGEASDETSQTSCVSHLLARTLARTCRPPTLSCSEQMLPLCKHGDEISSILRSLPFPALIAQQTAFPRHTDPASVPLQKRTQMSALADIMTW